jgi:hypothetical protein
MPDKPVQRQRQARHHEPLHDLADRGRLDLESRERALTDDGTRQENRKFQFNSTFAPP